MIMVMMMMITMMMIIVVMRMIIMVMMMIMMMFVLRWEGRNRDDRSENYEVMMMTGFSRAAIANQVCATRQVLD